MPYGQIVNPLQTTSGIVEGNLPATTATGESVQTGITMYDSQGKAQKVFYNFTKLAAANTWELDVVHENGTVLVNNASVVFNAAGALTTPAAPGTLAVVHPAGGHLPELDRRDHHRPVRA